MSGWVLKTWLHRIGYVSTVLVLAALAYVGWSQYRDWKAPRRVEASSPNPPRARAAMDNTVQLPRSSELLWTLTTKTSAHPEPRTVKICMNEDAPATLSTCYGDRAPRRTWDPSVVTVSCTDKGGSETISSGVSKDGRRARYRSDFEDYWGEKHWSESVMAYEGECPATMGKKQSFAVINAAGDAVDPFPATACMVAVLKTLPGATKPEAGYVWDASGGPWPFVRYLYPSRRDHTLMTVTFRGSEDLAGDPAKAVFGTEMDWRERGPVDYGREKIVLLWKARCGVTASIAYT